MKEYEAENKIILDLAKKNVGYPESFYELCKKVNDAEYYSFCDQDDIWYDDKILRAVNVLEQHKNENIPIMYYAAYDICDANANYISRSKSIKYNPPFRMSIFSCLGLGFTIVLNKCAKDMVLKRRSKKNPSKDVWIGMICSGLGESYYDDKPCAKWRRNEGSYSTSKTSFFQVQKERMRKLFKNDGFQYIYNIMNEFYEEFGEELNPAKKKELELFLKTNNIKKSFYPHKLRTKMIDDLQLRIVLLFGLIKSKKKK